MARHDLAIALAASVLAFACAAAAEPPAKAPAKSAPFAPKRTPWGDPDLRGTWPLDKLGRTPLQRAERYGTRAELTDQELNDAQKAADNQLAGYDREEKAGVLGVGHWMESGHPLRQTSLIVEPANGRLPAMTAEGKRRAAGMKSSWSQAVFDDLSDFNSLDRCITRGLPASMMPFPYNNGIRIFQAPGYVVLQLELIHETRIVPLDGRAPLPGQLRPWLGSSRGHFEGNTLVIDTTNFNGESPMVIVGPTNQPVPTSRSMHIVERLTPTGPDALQYEASVEDPEVLTGPWKMAFPWTRDDHYQLFEYACHEGNEQVGNYIRATSPRFAAQRKAAADARAAAAAAKPASQPPG
jgi:hypothetical protein